jgi:CDP-glycerol glycerophosphotransferase (TagB/SpsB family)
VHIASFENESTKRVIAHIAERDYKKVFIYMPTWRDSQREIFVQSFDLAKMNKMLQEKDSLLILKPHANTIVDHIEHYSNIILADSKADVYPILPYTDVLITDYSSVLYDYVLMENKDVILYLYDYEEYVKDRDLFYPFDENVVGKRVFNFEELYSCIEKEDYPIESEKKAEIVEKFWGKSAQYDSNNAIVSCFFH